MLVGLVRLVAGRRSGHVFALFLAASGLFAFVIHTYFIAAGRPEFALPASVVVLGLAPVASLAQGTVAIRALREPSAAPAAPERNADE